MRYHLAIEAYLGALSLPRSNNLSNVWPIRQTYIPYCSVGHGSGGS
jgi:hypothetical protein